MFNATMFMNNGQRFNKETTGNNTKKFVAHWEEKHAGLIAKIIGIVQSEGVISSEIAPVTRNTIIDTANANKKSGPDGFRGTYADIYLMPSMGRYVSEQFAAVIDSLVARFLIGDPVLMANLKQIETETAAAATEAKPSNKRTFAQSEDAYDRLVARLDAVCAENREMALESRELAKGYRAMAEKNAEMAAKTAEMLAQLLATNQTLNLVTNNPIPRGVSPARLRPPWVGQSGRQVLRPRGRPDHCQARADDVAKILTPLLEGKPSETYKEYVAAVCGIEKSEVTKDTFPRMSSVVFLTVLYAGAKARFVVPCFTHITWRQYYTLVNRYNTFAHSINAQTLVSREHDLRVRFGF
ncbi:hypothetical protein GHT06_003795 [Daphnia sinensis]|uniref:Uncharacterized protein n=1 Tax=Daphnia sinensis TaxID=1820382 RepID=A0AAD5KDQ8_9CRUS|nr:hypothetical protein GHT06_003795 [Daphnia sinensis]